MGPIKTVADTTNFRRVISNDLLTQTCEAASMTPVCQNESSQPGCTIILPWKKLRNNIFNHCRRNVDWSTTNKDCHNLKHLFLYNHQMQQPFMVTPEEAPDGLDTWSSRSLDPGEKIFSGLNGEMFYALCSPQIGVKIKEKILTTKALSSACPTTTTTTTTATVKPVQNQMSQRDLTNHLNKRKCPPSVKSSTSKEGHNSSVSSGLPVIDIFLNPAKAKVLKQVQKETAQELKKSRHQTQVSCHHNWTF